MTYLRTVITGRPLAGGAGARMLDPPGRPDPPRAPPGAPSRTHTLPAGGREGGPGYGPAGHTLACLHL